jgi:4-hydroxybenzoate polyprenyltransferase
VGHPLGRLALLHPFPSALNAGVVALIATVAGATAPSALLAAGAMFAIQASIGALNDLVDAPMDAVGQPSKPIPSGLVTPRMAQVIVVAGALVGLGLSLARSPLVLMLGVAGYACGVAYDLWLKERGLGWVAFSVAFPLLLVYAWIAGGGGLPPGWPALLPLAALAGPSLHLANCLVDAYADAAAGRPSPVLRLGRRRALWLLTGSTVTIQVLAWLVILGLSTGPLPMLIALASAVLAGVGLVGSHRIGGQGVAWGWSLQAVAVALLAVGWVLAVA